MNLSHLIESDDVTPATALQMVGTTVTLSMDIVGMTGERVTGTAIVKLRSDGGLYSGKGVSTDIVGAAIRAYIDALNKICYDEKA